VKTTLGNGRFFPRSGRMSFRRDSLAVLVAVLISWTAGALVAGGGMRAVFAVAVGVLAVGATVSVAFLQRRLPSDFAAVELPVLLLLLSELVLRQRDAESLASNPLDPAGLYRVGCIGLAGLLGVLALTSPIRGARERITTRPFRLYCWYVVVVFIGAPFSVNLLLTAYRGVELLAGILVAVGAFRRAGTQGLERILTLVYWFMAGSVMLVWLEAIILPGQALSPIDSPFPIQLHGVFPVISANGTGSLGALLGLWSLARLLSPPDRGKVTERALRFLTALGFVTLVFAQYRTGYIIAVVGLLVLLTMRAKAAAFWFVMGVGITAIVWGTQIVRQATPILQRGANPEVLSGLSGRLDYWANALPVWKESPFLGRGLLTASRFEVLAKLGAGYVSSIHGTWVEALVGTGLFGVCFLACSVLVAVYRALVEALREHGMIVPLLLLTSMLVRSITGTTFESAGTDSLVLITVTLLLRDRPPGHAKRLRSDTEMGAQH
jgi:O-antigen ligase